MLAGCTDEVRNTRRSFYCVKPFGQEGGMVDPAIVNGSTVLTLDRAKFDTHVDVQPYETYSACSTGNSCISENSKYICCETSCSPSQSSVFLGNQSRCPPGNHSCSSTGYSLQCYVSLFRLRPPLFHLSAPPQKEHGLPHMHAALPISRVLHESQTRGVCPPIITIPKRELDPLETI